MEIMQNSPVPSLETWGEIADYLPIPMVVINDEGKVVALNRAYANFLGIEQATAINQPVEKIIKGSRLPIVLKTGKPEIACPHQYRNSKGLVHRIPIYHNDKVIGCLGMVLFKDIQDMARLVQENHLLAGKLRAYQSELKNILCAKYTLQDIIGESNIIHQLKQQVKKIARTRMNVLITGETGVGKELWAHAIHMESESKEEPFIAVNCAAIPENLLEAELFGYEEGAFTGAARGGRLGKFQLANGGTIFLDEIGDMPINMQAKILRVLQEREVERLGASRPEIVDVRVIAATNCNLKQLIKEGKFRKDLYYRLNVFNLNIPPLREHPEDIPLLIQHFLSKLYHETGIYRRMSDECLKALLDYQWPGNIRELRFLIDRLALKTDSEIIQLEDLPIEILSNVQMPKKTEGMGLDNILEQVEHEIIMKTLEKTHFNKRKAASILKIPRSRLYRKLETYYAKGKGTPAK